MAETSGIDTRLYVMGARNFELTQLIAQAFTPAIKVTQRSRWEQLKGFEFVTAEIEGAHEEFWQAVTASGDFLAYPILPEITPCGNPVSLKTIGLS